MKLHTKTTFLNSVITVAVMLATVLLISVRMGGLVREDEEELAQLQALSVAEQINLMGVRRDEDDLARAAAQAHRGHPNLVTVRLWDYRAGSLSPHLASPGSPPAEAVGDETRRALERNPALSDARTLPGERAVRDGDQFYRVFAPISIDKRLTGAVEVTARLDSIPSIVKEYAWNALWLSVIAVGLITLATYSSFRYLVYSPLQRLLKEISQADKGGGEAKAVEAFNEIDLASQEYHRMLDEVQALTVERDRRQEILRESVRDATQELRFRNEQLAEANRELWQTSRRLSQMERLAVAGQTAAQFAHEVGTPLNTIGIHVELLREAVQRDPEAARRTTIISEQIELIERIVRAMLDRTRVEKPVLELLDVRALLERILETTEPMLRSRNVRLDSSFEDGLPGIAGEPDRLQQVFINLINNAIDAMAATGGGVLWLDARRAGDCVVVSLSDTGCGMTDETRARIFEPFYTTKDRGRGTGLGLVVVKQILEDHLAEIEVESEPGRGSRFTLRFPCVAHGEPTMNGARRQKEQDGRDAV